MSKNLTTKTEGANAIPTCAGYITELRELAQIAPVRFEAIEEHAGLSRLSQHSQPDDAVGALEGRGRVGDVALVID
jgi:hypothetical protein